MQHGATGNSERFRPNDRRFRTGRRGVKRDDRVRLDVRPEGVNPVHRHHAIEYLDDDETDPDQARNRLTRERPWLHGSRWSKAFAIPAQPIASIGAWRLRGARKSTCAGRK